MSKTRRERRRTKLQATNEALRTQIKQLQEELMLATPGTGDGEFIVFLSDKHSELLRMLYSAQSLSFGSNPDYWYTNPDFDEAFADFVEGTIEIAWDMFQLEKEKRKRERAEKFFEHN